MFKLKAHSGFRDLFLKSLMNVSYSFTLFVFCMTYNKNEKWCLQYRKRQVKETVCEST